MAERFHHVNPEVLAPYADKAPGVLLSCGHYGNWERYAVTSGDALPLPFMGVYKRLSNAFYDDLIFQTRSQFGTELVEMKQVSAWMVEEQGRAKAVTLAVDQRPLDPKKAWWMGQRPPCTSVSKPSPGNSTCPWSSSACARLRASPRALGGPLRPDH